MSTKVVICGSLQFGSAMKRIAEALEVYGLEAILPLGASPEVNLGVTFERLMEMKEDGSVVQLTIDHDAIRDHYNNIMQGDAVLIVNEEKKGIAGYIGGNTFLEMGFAYIARKPIFVLNDIPDMIYIDEIRAMQPIVINGDFDQLLSSLSYSCV